MSLVISEFARISSGERSDCGTGEIGFRIENFVGNHHHCMSNFSAGKDQNIHDPTRRATTSFKARIIFQLS